MQTWCSNVVQVLEAVRAAVRANPYSPLWFVAHFESLENKGNAVSPRWRTNYALSNSYSYPLDVPEIRNDPLGTSIQNAIAFALRQHARNMPTCQVFLVGFTVTDDPEYLQFLGAV